MPRFVFHLIFFNAAMPPKFRDILCAEGDIIP